MEKLTFTPVTEAHLAPLTDVFNYYVERSTALFVTEPIAASDMRAMLFFDDPRYAALAIYAGDALAGYASIHAYRPRGAFSNTAELTIFLHPDFTGRGIGALALARLEAHAKEHKLHVLLGSIAGENAASLRLFAKCGYAECARLREVGYKFGRWLDVVWYEKIL